jgi:hypothetical protein
VAPRARAAGLLTVRAVLGRLSAIGVFLCKSVLYGGFVWARRALNRPKPRFPARAATKVFVWRKTEVVMPDGSSMRVALHSFSTFKGD